MWVCEVGWFESRIYVGGWEEGMNTNVDERGLGSVRVIASGLGDEIPCDHYINAFYRRKRGINK